MRWCTVASDQGLPSVPDIPSLILWNQQSSPEQAPTDAYRSNVGYCLSPQSRQLLFALMGCIGSPFPTKWTGSRNKNRATIYPTPQRHQNGLEYLVRSLMVHCKLRPLFSTLGSLRTRFTEGEPPRMCITMTKNPVLSRSAGL